MRYTNLLLTYLLLTYLLTNNLHNPAVGPDQFRRNLKPACLPVHAIQMYIYLLTLSDCRVHDIKSLLRYR